jgi:hypothetical protein
MLRVEEKKEKKEEKKEGDEKEKKEKAREMKEGESDDEQELEKKPQRDAIVFQNPYTYEQLLDRINDIIKQNNTYSSKKPLIQRKARISSSSPLQ